MTRIRPVRWEPERRSLSRGMAICWRWKSPLESKSSRRVSCWFAYQGRFECADRSAHAKAHIQHWSRPAGGQLDAELGPCWRDGQDAQLPRGEPRFMSSWRARTNHAGASPMKTTLSATCIAFWRNARNQCGVLQIRWHLRRWTFASAKARATSIPFTGL